MTTRGTSWRRSNPSDVLKRLIAENPKAGRRKLLLLFLDQVRGPDANRALDSVTEYWFEANYDRLAGGNGHT
jgi:hypothetical protein